MIFDPFENRQCRDIRNQLSEFFLTALQTRDPSILTAVVNTQKQKALDPHHLDYIDDRIKRYEKVLNLADPKSQGQYPMAKLLWDQKLFFECHEWLEPFWINAVGHEKKAIQALIRTAGTYVLLEANRQSGAQKSAPKAIALLQEYKQYIPSVFKPDQLIQYLGSGLPY